MEASVHATTSVCDVAVYIDDNDRQNYPEPGPLQIVGPQIGAARSANALVEAFPDYSVYGFLPDDSVMLVEGWGEHLLEIAERFRGGIGLIDIPNGGEPADGGLWWVDTPFLTAKWVKTLGWFCPPRFQHWCWPIALGALGKAVASHRPSAERVNLQHIRDWPQSLITESAEREAFWQFFVGDFAPCVDRLREAAEA